MSERKRKREKGIFSKNLVINKYRVSSHSGSSRVRKGRVRVVVVVGTNVARLSLFLLCNKHTKPRFQRSFLTQFLAFFFSFHSLYLPLSPSHSPHHFSFNPSPFKKNFPMGVVIGGLRAKYTNVVLKNNRKNYT